MPPPPGSGPEGRNRSPRRRQPRPPGESPPVRPGEDALVPCCGRDRRTSPYQERKAASFSSERAAQPYPGATGPKHHISLRGSGTTHRRSVDKEVCRVLTPGIGIPCPCTRVQRLVRIPLPARRCVRLASVPATSHAAEGTDGRQPGVAATRGLLLSGRSSQVPPPGSRPGPHLLSQQGSQQDPERSPREFDGLTHRELGTHGWSARIRRFVSG